MKLTHWIFALIFGLIATPTFAQEWQCDYYLPQCPDKARQYEKESNAVSTQIMDLKITFLEGTKKYIEISERMHPNDKVLNDMSKQTGTLAEFVVNSNASPEAMLKMLKLNSDLQGAFIKERFEMANAFTDVRNDIQRQQQSRTSAGNTAAIATLLNGIGKAFTNSFGQSITPPPRICNYYGGTSYCF